MSQGRDAATVLAVEDRDGPVGRYRGKFDSYEVRTASGAAALSALDGVDVVVFDRELAGVSDEDILDAVRGRDCRAAVVAAAAPGFDAVARGFDAWLVKPIAGAVLREAVERLLARSAYVDAVDALHEACERRAGGDADFEAVRERRDAADRFAAGFDDEDFRAVFRDLD